MSASQTSFFSDENSNVSKARLFIRNLGPIRECELTPSSFTILAGPQASGKSTIAKCLYYFRSVKDILLDVIIKYKTLQYKDKLERMILNALSIKFDSTFDILSFEGKDMQAIFYYSSEVFVEIAIHDNQWSTKLSDPILEYIGNVDLSQPQKSELRVELNSLFCDDYECIFIPAGRSFTSILSRQLTFFYASMDDFEKDTIEYCTRKYIERELRVRELYDHGFKGLIARRQLQSQFDLNTAEYFENIVRSVMKGDYICSQGMEILHLDDGTDIGLPFASSGQQELVGISNILFDILTSSTKTCIIVEEPEAHLYPDAQKAISELLAVMSNNSCELVVTTHSPYILGALNNFIYANYLSQNLEQNALNKLNNLVNPISFIKDHTAYFVNQGCIQPCLEDTPERLIMNEVIDGASADINGLYDALFNLTVGGNDRDEP